jgi:hypothetical protein
MENYSKPETRFSSKDISSFKNARLNQEGYSTVKKSIVSALKNETIPQPKETLKSQRVDELTVTANRFAEKVKTMDSSLTASSYGAKLKLMEMRYQNTDKKLTGTDEFNVLLENKPYAITFYNKLKLKVVIINPEKIASGLDNINIPISAHQVTDQFNQIPPASKKIADLQQFLGIKINGLFDAETFNSLVETYSKALLKHNVRTLNMLEKLIISLLSKIGSEIKPGAILKGLLAVKTAIGAALAGRSGDEEKLNAIMEKYLPDTIRFKLKERTRVVQKLYQALNSPPNEKSAKLKFILREEKNNLVTEDKLKILESYINLSSTIFSNEGDKQYQIDLLKTIVEDNLNIEQKLKVNKIIDFFLRYYKEGTNPEMLNEIENLYNRIRVQALKGMIS